MKHCMYCDTLMAKDAVFCPKCGRKQKNKVNNDIKISNTSNSNKNSIFNNIWVNYWKRYFHGHGFSSRSQYWGMVLINLIIVIVCYGLHFAIPFITMNSSALTDNNFVFLYNLPLQILIIYGFIALIPSVSLNCRRLRDVGLSNVEVIVLIICDFIPIVNWIASIINLVCVCLPTSENRKR